MKHFAGDLVHNGWMRLPFQFSSNELDTLSELDPHIGRGQRLLDMQAVTEALPLKFKNCLQHFGFIPTPNRAIGFAKSQKANWSLPWHQDRVIAMSKRNEDPVFTNWTCKSGLWHCEPTEEILQKMAFAYIAFDDIKDGMGRLELAEGSHKFGKITEADIPLRLHSSTLVKPDMSPGDVIIISALTLHRSAVMTGIGRRRTLRLDYSSEVF